MCASEQRMRALQCLAGSTQPGLCRVDPARCWPWRVCVAVAACAGFSGMLVSLVKAKTSQTGYSERWSETAQRAGARVLVGPGPTATLG